MTHQPWCQKTRAQTSRGAPSHCTCHRATPDDPRWTAYVEDLRLRVEEQTRIGRVTTLEPPLDRTLAPPTGTSVSNQPGIFRRMWRWIRGR